MNKEYNNKEMQTNFLCVEVARKINIPAGILIAHIAFWVTINELKEQTYAYGEYWTYDSVNNLHKRFKYMSESTISRALSKLEKNGYIKTAVLNKHKYDRTKWYTLTDKGRKANHRLISNVRNNSHNDTEW